MRIFSCQTELIQYGRKIILAKVASLENDVQRCIGPTTVTFGPAPFPALLFCFSVIDFLGAFLAGNAKSGAKTAEQARAYMERFMIYTEEQALLLQDVFRHKLVHLADPKPVRKDTKSRLITWREWHDNRMKHLTIEKLLQKERILITSVFQKEFDHVFHVGIWNLVEDIKTSVEKPGGYLDSLEKSADLQDKFENALIQLYEDK